MATGAAIAGTVVSAKQGRAAGKRADAAGDAAAQSSQAQLDFNQEQLDNWEANFGGMEQNVTDYYSNLDPDKYATQGKQMLGSSIDKQMKQFTEEMASKGMMTSGMQAQTQKEAAFNKATGNAAIDLGAEEKVMGMKEGYVNSKEHRRTNALSGSTAAFSGQQAMYSGQQAQQGASQQGYMTAAGGMFGTAMGLGINGGSSGLNDKGWSW